MEAAQIIRNVLTLNAGVMDLALEALSDGDLLEQPNDQSNPAGWLLWHQARTEDRLISAVSGEPQVWTDRKWADSFGLEPDPTNTGLGHTLEQVMALKPTLKAVKGYTATVRERTLTYLSRLKPAALDQEIKLPDQDPRTVGEYLGILLADHLHHSGQACYLRGFYKGWGWFPM